MKLTVAGIKIKVTQGIEDHLHKKIEKSLKSLPESADVERKLHQYRVVPGDSLWAIACRDLGTGSDARINRRWREIYVENREIIGSNPDLIFPGQMLSIPESSDG